MSGRDSLVLALVQLEDRCWTGAGLSANNKAEQWVGGWMMKAVAGRVERALYGSLVAGFRKRRSDRATPDKQEQRGCSGAMKGVEAAELDDVERSARELPEGG
jgi:hypothetical protein